MKLAIIDMTERSARFILDGVDPSFSNALRRTLIADVPKMAIEDVEFHLGPIRGEDGKEYESIAPLFDEIIAHRLGLIPIPTDLDLFVPREECKDCGGEGCPNCTIMYSLNKRGPCSVYSRDLEPVGDAKFKVVDDSIPIVKLGAGQAILVYATAILGTGKQHAKWQAVYGVGYKYFPIIKINDEKCDLDRACIESCPKHIFEVHGKKIVVRNIEECNLCKACVEACAPKCVEVKGDPNKFIIHFETDGSLSSKEALTAALKILEDKFREFEKTAGKLK